MSQIQTKAVKKIIGSLVNTRSQEIGCDTCYEELDRFVDMLREGKDPAKIMPLVEHHLETCSSCHEEYQALLDALAALDTSS